MKRNVRGVLQYALLTLLSLGFLALCALAPGYYAAYQDQTYLGKLETAQGEQLSYSYQGALQNKVDTLEKWLSASPDVSATLESLDADGLAYVDELERNLIAKSPSAPMEGQRITLQHLNYPSAVSFLHFEGERTEVYVDAKTGKVLRYLGRMPDWLSAEALEASSAALEDLLPSLASACSQYLGLGSTASLLEADMPAGMDGLVQMRFATEQQLIISIFLAPNSDMLYIKLESGDSV